MNGSSYFLLLLTIIKIHKVNSHFRDASSRTWAKDLIWLALYFLNKIANLKCFYNTLNDLAVRTQHQANGQGLWHKVDTLALKLGPLAIKTLLVFNQKDTNGTCNVITLESFVGTFSNLFVPYIMCISLQ